MFQDDTYSGKDGASACAAGRRGFTLAELLAVMLIIMILMGMAVNSFYGLGRGARMRGAVSTFNAVMALTRQYAITRTAPMEVVLLQTDTDVYGYEVRREGTLFRPTQYLPPSMRFVEVRQPGVPPLTDFTAGFSFTYLPDGSIDGIMGELGIDINDETGALITFSINGLTGFVTVTGD